MASSGGTRVPELVACVVGLSRGRGDSFSQHQGIGKSCLCYRFMHPGFDDYIEDHQSLLALHEFENAVINNVHFLYWGSVVKNFPMKNSERCAPVQFHVIEQTVFYQDVTSQPFTIITKPDSLDHYIKRITGQIESPGKLSYKSRNEIEGYSHKQPYPSGLSRLPRGFMVVLDVSLSDNEFEGQMKRAEHLLDHLMKHKRKYIIVAAKRDNYDFDSLERAHELKRKYRTQLIETSANGNLNVRDAFRLLACKTLHKKPHGLSDSIPTYEDAAHQILKAKGHVKRSFQTFLTKRVTDSDERLHSVASSEEYVDCQMLIGKFETDRLFAVHALQLHNERISLYAGVSENPDMRQEFLEEYVERRADLTAYSQYLKNWIDSYMDELPESSGSNSPDSTQGQPDSEPPEPYIKFEKPQPKGLVESPSHQTLDSGCPPDTQSQISALEDDASASKPDDNDSYYSDSSNFDDHDYENFNPKEARTMPSRASSNIADPAPTIHEQLVATVHSRVTSDDTKSSSLSSVSGSQHGASPSVHTASSLEAPPTQQTSSSIQLGGNVIPQQPPQSPSLKDRAKLLETQILPSPTNAVHSPKSKRGGNPPPPPTRKSSSLTRPVPAQTSTSSLPGSPQLDNRPRKSSLPSSPQSVKKNTNIERSQSIKVQAAKLQGLLAGRVTQDEPDTTSDNGSPMCRQSSGEAPPPTSSKPKELSPFVPPPQELAAAILTRKGAVSPAISQSVASDDSKELDKGSMVNGAESDPKAEENAQLIEAKEQYKPRLQMIKQKVAEKRMREREALSNNPTVSDSVTNVSSPSVEHVLPPVSGSGPGDSSPNSVVFPPMVPPKPKPVKVDLPSIPSNSSSRGKNDNEGECPPLPPPLKTEDIDDAADEEEPPPLPARTPAMFIEVIEKPLSPKKSRKPNYTNVELDSERKGPTVLPPHPPPPSGDKKEKKKTSNYPRTLIKKLKSDKKERTPEPSVKKSKSKDAISPNVSPTRKQKESPTRKSPTKKVKRARSDAAGNNKVRPTSGPVEVRRPVFIKMSKRPLPLIPGQSDPDEDPPEHTADDYEEFELGRGGMPFTSTSSPYYANYGPNGMEPLPKCEPLEYKNIISARNASSVQRAHSFNPGDKCPGGRSNFDPLPVPPNLQRSAGTMHGAFPDYVGGYVNTDSPNQLPARGKPFHHDGQNRHPSSDNPDYDYPDLRKPFFTLPSRRPNTHNLAKSHNMPSVWGNDGYPSVQRQNTSQSDSIDDDRCDSDYVPMASIPPSAMDDSYINWETINVMHGNADLSKIRQLLPQPQTQQVLPPRGGQTQPTMTYAVDDMSAMYQNLSHESTARNRAPFHHELARACTRQQSQPTEFASASAVASLKPTDTSSSDRGIVAPPSPRPKPKTRQRSATTAGALEQDTVPVAPGPSHSPAPERAWHMLQPTAVPQLGSEDSVYQNIDTSASLPASLFGQHLKEGFDRRVSEGDALTIKPTAAALPPRNIPRRPPN